MSRIRTNLITNRMANGAHTVSHGLVISGVTTVTGSINNLNLTGITTISTLDLNGDLDVDGHLNADNLSVAGVTTFSTSPVVHNGGYYKGIINSGSQQKIVGGYISGSDTLRLGESMYLTTTGLGIGVASPTQKLDVNGSVKATGADINGDLDVF